MGKGRPRAVEKGVLGQNLSVCSSTSLNIPSGPAFYPTEDEFRDPLEYIYKIRPEAEPYGICRIVPPKNWKPPFALRLDSFTFPTKTQAIHQLQVRPAACDSETFELEYNRFLDGHFGKKMKKKVVFEGDELDLCKLFNAVKRYGGYDKVVKEKRWGEVFRFVRSTRKISECAKHVLCQLYREHLYDYENYYNQLNKDVTKSSKRKMQNEKLTECLAEISTSKRRRQNTDDCRVKVSKLKDEEDNDQICEQCKSGLHGEVMLLCDRCDKGWHLYCLSPPLKQVPPGNWYCLDCLNSEKDSFGFVPGKSFSLEAFKRMDCRAKKKWFGSGSASRTQIEKKFWEIVEGSFGEVEVKYGSDLDTSVYGSGFPRENVQRPESIDAKLWDEYCNSPWNLNNLPKLEGSMLRAIRHNITGVMVPWLYIGMLFSSFCWHFEDHCFYSMNYLHWGDPKCWYSVPGSEATAFEKVMRNNLPDLFDAQPDLLFQLVTMLNPSVLQENGVPVYTVQQEPGNFVVTFPRSYHGGFNLGLNCAEAVNFAPADWMPYGGFGEELYQLYHKPAVFSHEELICVIAKMDCNDQVSPYLKKELLRIYSKEKSWREQLWKNGVIRSSPLPPRKCPEYISTEEDPTCVICKKYLYLSAIGCHCRRSAFVCLEHWQHLCECKYSRRRLRYRYTLAELYDLIAIVDKSIFGETTESKDLRRVGLCFTERCTLTKKVKGGRVTLTQLAEKWLLHSSKILLDPFSNEACVKVMREAEQFLWAGHDMDHVRDVVRNLDETQKWVQGIGDSICKIEAWSCDHSGSSEKICMDHVNNLLSLPPISCNHPGYLKLKDYVEEAKMLIQDIDNTLSRCPNVSEWEILYSRVCAFPVHIKESEKLSEKISIAKSCIESVREILEKQPAAFEVEVLYKLKFKILELGIQLPETEMVLDLIRQAELCRSKCEEIMKAPMNLKIVKQFLQESNGFAVNIPELKLLRQYHDDAVSWKGRLNAIMVNVHEREDQHNVIEELNCILRDGLSLTIKVDDVPLVEVELQKASVREKAQKVIQSNTKNIWLLRDTKVTMEFMQKLMEEAVELELDKEKLFADIRGVLDSAMSLEKRAMDFLSHGARLSDFEEIIRTSEDLCVILPSLHDVKNEVSLAKSWLNFSKPFLESVLPMSSARRSQLKIETLKELVSQSKLLKVTLDESRTLETVLRNCENWKEGANSLLQDIDNLLNASDIGDGLSNCLIPKIEQLIDRINTAITASLSLDYDFREISRLQSACSTLIWCNKVLSLCHVIPSYQDVESLLSVEENSSCLYASSVMSSLLVDGVKWLKQALEVIPGTCNFKQRKLSDAEELLSKFQSIRINFSAMNDQLVNAIRTHKLWLEEVRQFFVIKRAERLWTRLLKLKEKGDAVSFNCSELQLILSEAEKIEKWKKHMREIMKTSFGDESSLLGCLLEIKKSLDRSLNIYEKSLLNTDQNLCVCCSSDSQDQHLFACTVCKESYHLQCLGQAKEKTNSTDVFMCYYCCSLRAVSLVDKSGGPLRFLANRPELGMLTKLKSDALNFYVWMEEEDVLQQLVEQALVCKSHLTEVLDFASRCLDKDFSTTCKRLTVALKAMDVAGINDQEGKCGLEMELVRNSWRFRVKEALEGSEKPTMQQVLELLEEGSAISIPLEDFYRKKLLEVKIVCSKWRSLARKISADCGALELEKVFELIVEGENLPAYLERELKLLRNRSMLYCICRKPNDRRPMLACDICEEWYHFDCVKIESTPKIYICPACKPQVDNKMLIQLSTEYESSIGTKFVEPKTPSPQRTKQRSKPKKTKRNLVRSVTDCYREIRCPSGIERLWWQNRKPFRRVTRRRAEFGSLSPFFLIEQ
ncbi:lysine-specific demethylase 5A isoform X1 [Cucurbita moschata]|uniref:Lysine-specific demethylase 5A isoform X1 n=1 Tax=Cucurbita moschata TaxID=3662 RepID=A0A6J1EQB1_CUCMO|nr:lysine-specific demethylase 5A isoform X1 [Cucurbita moschata]